MAKRPSDIVLLDIQMPGRNGMDTARLLRQNDRATATGFPMFEVWPASMPGIWSLT